MNYAEFKENYKDNKKVYIIISSPKYETEIFDFLRKDFSEDNIFSFECELYYSYIHNIPDYRTWMVENKNRFKKLYDILSDELSKQTLENVLKGRISAELKYFKNVYVTDQYFVKDIVKLGNAETFIDVGAYIGDTVEQINKITGGEYSRIYCFEPDSNVCEVLRKNAVKYKNIYIIQKGAWNKNEKFFLKEDAEHGASAINEEGKVAIELDCIDDCIEDDVKITHIKMDIEGAELNALKGCEKIIKKYTPRLAICIYHRNEDFLEIPKYITSIVPEYKLYVRHHNVSGTETVLYAIK